MSASSDQKQNEVFSVSVQLEKKKQKTSVVSTCSFHLLHLLSLSIYLPSKTQKTLQHCISEIKINQR